RSSSPPASGKPDAPAPKPRRKQMAQADVPSMSLDEATRVARGLAEDAFKPVSPLDAAKAVGMQPGSGNFRVLLGAAQADGLREGGAYADKITATRLAQRIAKPTVEGDDLSAMREALLRPRVIREFLTSHNEHKVPRDDIAKNVLEKLGVPT